MRKKILVKYYWKFKKEHILDEEIGVKKKVLRYFIIRCDNRRFVACKCNTPR